jgi:hypothetical protein
MTTEKSNVAIVGMAWKARETAVQQTGGGEVRCEVGHGARFAHFHNYALFTTYADLHVEIFEVCMSRFESKQLFTADTLGYLL